MKKINFKLFIFIMTNAFLIQTGATTYNITDKDTIAVTTGYIDNLEDDWNVTGSVSNQPLAIYYSISTEANYDNVYIFEVDNNGNSTLKKVLSGNRTGVVYMTNPNGKARIAFSTDNVDCYNPPYYTGIYLSFSYPDNLLISNKAVFNTVRGSLNGGALRIKSDYGTLDIGAQDASWTHIQTDKPGFIFNKSICVSTGEFNTYFTNLSLQTGGTSRITILNGSGNVGIGTTSPEHKLDIRSSPGKMVRLLTNSGSSEESAFAQFQSRAIVGYDCVFHGLKLSTSDYTKPIVFTNSIENDGTGELMRITGDGKVGIGTSVIPSAYKLAVAGKVIAEEVVIKLQSNWPDYVFKPGYPLKPISEVESFVKENQHLPGVPDAASVENEGVSMGEMQAKLLQKIEELTLYIIQQNNRIEELEKKFGR